MPPCNDLALGYAVTAAMCIRTWNCVGRRGVDDALDGQPLDDRTGELRRLVECGLHVHRHLDVVNHVTDYAKVHTGFVSRQIPPSGLAMVPGGRATWAIDCV
jgi:hypothetical protein